MGKPVFSVLLVGSLLGVSVLGGAVACDEKKTPDPAPAEADATPEVVETPEPTDDEPTEAEKKAAAEAAARAEKEAEAQAELAQNPLTECCRALGKKGFTMRSPEYMAASKACGESLEAEEKVAQAMPAIEKALKGQPLPNECQQ